MDLPVIPSPLLPEAFLLCIDCLPDDRESVLISHDEKCSGNSFEGLPGQDTVPFRAGDWMIRALIDRPKP